MQMTISSILGATETRLVSGERSALVTGCSVDTRTVREGDLFVAFPGERVDGNDFVLDAARAGAACVAMTREPTAEELAALEGAGCAVLVPVSPEPDQERLLLSLASLWRASHEGCVVVGVTGSVGKTTTKEMLAAALGTLYPVHATSGNLNSMIGVALTVLSAPEDARVVVAEMGMNHAGELWRQARAIRPNLAVITNVGTSHIGNLGSREAIARAKAEVLSGLEPTPFAPGGGKRLFMRGEEDFRGLIAGGLAPLHGVDVTLVGESAEDDVRGGDVEVGEDGLASFTVTYADGERARLGLSVPGAHVVPDALFALAVADYLRCDREAARVAVSAVRPAAMRLEAVTAEGRPRVLDDSYNASPASMAGALDVLRSMACEGRRVAVLGEMGELGDEAARLHALVGAYAAACGVDLLACVGGALADEIAGGATTMGMSPDRVERFADPHEAASVLGPVLSCDDLVLAKASRAAGLDAFAREVLGR